MRVESARAATWLEVRWLQRESLPRVDGDRLLSAVAYRAGGSHCDPGLGAASLLYAHRRLVTPCPDTNPLVEPHPFASAMQRAIAQWIENTDPDYLVLLGIDYSWLCWSGSDGWIFNWLTEYQRGSHRAGLIDVYPDWPGEFRWLDWPGGERPRSSCFIAVSRNNRLALR